MSRLVSKFPERFKRFIPLLLKEITNQESDSNNPLNLAMHALTSRNMGLEYKRDIEKLQKLQTEYGDYPAVGFFKQGRSQQYFGCKALTTAFAVKAIEHEEKTKIQLKPI